MFLSYKYGSKTPSQQEVELADKEGKDTRRGRLRRFSSPTGTVRGDLSRAAQDFKDVGGIFRDLFREERNSWAEILHPPETPPIITGIAAILSRGDPAATEGGIIADPPSATGQPEEKSAEVSLYTPEPARKNPDRLFAYPFTRRPDWRDTHHPYKLPADIAQAISQIKDPIVEVGGATRNGYRFLGNEQLFSSEPVITDANFYDNDTVERLDGREMPFFDNSIGMFLVSHMGDTDYPSFEAIERRRAIRGVWAQQERWWAVADAEMRQLIEDPRDIPQFNLHAKILREMARTLAPNGLILWQNINGMGMAYAERLGLEPICVEPEWNDTENYSVIFKKIPMAE